MSPPVRVGTRQPTLALRSDRPPWDFKSSVPWELDVQQVIPVPLVGWIRLHLNLLSELPQLLVRHEARLEIGYELARLPERSFHRVIVEKLSFVDGSVAEHVAIAEPCAPGTARILDVDLPPEQLWDRAKSPLIAAHPRHLGH